MIIDEGEIYKTTNKKTLLLRIGNKFITVGETNMVIWQRFQGSSIMQGFACP